MEYVRGRQDGEPVRFGTDTFTGRAMVNPLVHSEEGQRQVRVNSVSFEPGARTYWHSHDDGQLILVTTGHGAVATRDDEQELRPGDTVWTAPGEEHWHGAAPDSFMAHTAVTLGPTQWREEVDDESYRAPFSQRPAGQRDQKE